MDFLSSRETATPLQVSLIIALTRALTLSEHCGRAKTHSILPTHPNQRRRRKMHFSQRMRDGRGDAWNSVSPFLSFVPTIALRRVMKARARFL